MGTVEIMPVHPFLLNAKVLLTFLGRRLKSALLSVGNMHPKILYLQKKGIQISWTLTPPDTG